MILAIALFCMFPTPQLSFQASPFCYSWFLPFERNVREDWANRWLMRGLGPMSGKFTIGNVTREEKLLSWQYGYGMLS